MKLFGVVLFSLLVLPLWAKEPNIDDLVLLGTIQYTQPKVPFGSTPTNNVLHFNPPQDLAGVVFVPQCGEGVFVTKPIPSRTLAPIAGRPNTYIPNLGNGGVTTHLGVFSLNVTLKKDESCPIEIYGQLSDTTSVYGKKVCEGTNTIDNIQAPFWTIDFNNCSNKGELVQSLLVKSVNCLWGRQIVISNGKYGNDIPYLKTTTGGFERLLVINSLASTGGMAIKFETQSKTAVPMSNFVMPVVVQGNGFQKITCTWEVYLPAQN